MMLEFARCAHNGLLTAQTSSQRSNCLFLVAVDCGVPPNLPHATALWRNSSTLGSSVLYQCDPGYRNDRAGNTSVCSASGEWSLALFLCQGETANGLRNVHLRLDMFHQLLRPQLTAAVRKI